MTGLATRQEIVTLLIPRLSETRDSFNNPVPAADASLDVWASVIDRDIQRPADVRGVKERLGPTIRPEKVFRIRQEALFGLDIAFEGVHVHWRGIVWMVEGVETRGLQFLDLLCESFGAPATALAVPTAVGPVDSLIWGEDTELEWGDETTLEWPAPTT